MVIIYVEDINDNYLVFIKNLYFVEMLENVFIGYIVINVIVYDKDEEKDLNGWVIYFLVESLWVIDKLVNNIFIVNDIIGVILILKKLKLNVF